MINPFDLTGRRILVTGASSGIGRATAILLSELGARLIVTGRNQERLQQTHAQLHGESHIAEPFDLTNLDAIGEWLRGLTKDAPLNGLVHAAGKQITTPLRGLTSANLDDVFRTNVTSAALLARAYAQKGCHHPGGSILFVSSVMAVVARPAISSYCASKAALSGLAKSLALELARSRTRVNCIAPAFVATEMLDAIREMSTQQDFAALETAHPLGFGTPLDVASASAFLLSDAARWITGTTLTIDGGYTCQ